MPFSLNFNKRVSCLGFFFVIAFIVPARTVNAQDLCSNLATERGLIRMEPGTSFLKSLDEPATRVSVAMETIADVYLVTPRQILITARQTLDNTNLIVWYSDERADLFTIQVSLSQRIIDEVLKHIKSVCPTSDIRLMPTLTGLLVDGIVESQNEQEAILSIIESDIIANQAITNLMKVRGSQQIQLEVKVAEVSRSNLKNMGFGFLVNRDFNAGLLSSGSITAGTSATKTQSSPTVTEISDSTGPIWTEYTNTGGRENSSTSTMSLSSPFASAFQIAIHSLDQDIMGVLSIMKGQNLANILATPTLVAMNGQDASFLVGGEFPIPYSGDNGQTAIQYKNYGTMLQFTPYLTGKDTLTLRIQSEVSNIDYSTAVASGGVAVPGLKTRRGETTLQLKDGQTFVMAGLLREQTVRVENKVPFLGDIPLLGALFTTKEFQREETELMIIVTPRLVRALSPEEVPPLPGESLPESVSDLDFFFLNKTVSGKKKKGLPSVEKQFMGETGYDRSR